MAAKLGLGADELVVVRARRCLLNGHPVETATSYIPASIARGSQSMEPNTGPGGIYARLEGLGHRLDHFSEEIRARIPLRDEARALKPTPGVPVFPADGDDEAGRAVEVCDTVMSGDAYVLSYELPAR